MKMLKNNELTSRNNLLTQGPAVHTAALRSNPPCWFPKSAVEQQLVLVQQPSMFNYTMKIAFAVKKQLCPSAKTFTQVQIWGVYSKSIIDFLQSAIGEGMTRRDHADVSNQVCLGSHNTNSALSHLKPSNLPFHVLFALFSAICKLCNWEGCPSNESCGWRRSSFF